MNVKWFTRLPPPSCISVNVGAQSGRKDGEQPFLCLCMGSNGLLNNVLDLSNGSIVLGDKCAVSRKAYVQTWGLVVPRICIIPEQTFMKIMATTYKHAL